MLAVSPLLAAGLCSWLSDPKPTLSGPDALSRGVAEDTPCVFHRLRTTLLQGNVMPAHSTSPSEPLGADGMIRYFPTTQCSARRSLCLRAHVFLFTENKKTCLLVYFRPTVWP